MKYQNIIIKTKKFGLPYIGEKKPYEINAKETYTIGYYIAKNWCMDEINDLLKIEKEKFIKRNIINITNAYFLSLYANYYRFNINDRLKHYNLCKQRLINMTNELKNDHKRIIKKTKIRKRNIY